MNTEEHRFSINASRAWLGVLLILMAGCASHPAATPAPTHTSTATATTTKTLTPTASVSPSPTEPPALTLVFYGDSDLKVGEVGRQGEAGFSFVDNLRLALDPPHTLIMANYGGKSARWGYENLEQSALSFEPDLVTIWWGMNDLSGCPGIFDPQTNELLQYKLTARVDEHVKNLKLQIDALLDHGSAAIIMTSLPVLGDLPWSHLGPNNELIWENDRRCEFNRGLIQLVEAQRNLVVAYTAEGQPVYLVDVWQIYQDHPNADKMYMDIVHPASHGVELIAEEWLRVFQSMQR